MPEDTKTHPSGVGDRPPESYLRDVLPDNPRSVLEVGTGRSGVFDFSEWERRNPRLKVCVDIHSIREDTPWLKVIADGSLLPFKDDTFDVVQCTETLEHVPPERWDDFIRELCRVSKDLVYITTSDRTKHLGPEQARAEKLNPFQRFISFPSTRFFTNRGFHILFASPHHIIAFKRKIPSWNSTFRDMEDYVAELTKDMEVDSVLDVGTGNKGVVGQHYYENVKHIRAGYACDIWTIKSLPPVWTPLRMDALDLLDRLGEGSVDVVQAFGFLEHLEKSDGLRFLEIAESIARKLVIVSAATYVHGPTQDYKAKMDGNPYHIYRSTWHWREFENLGYSSNFEDMRNGTSFSGEAIAWLKK